MDHALCKQRKKAIFVEWFTVWCQIYMSREDAGGVVSRKEKKIASVKVWKKDCKWEREKCKYSLWWVVALQPLQTGMRLLQLREQETYSICFDKHVGSIAIPHAALLHNNTKWPLLDCRFCLNPTAPSPAYFHTHCDLILHHSGELSVCFDAVAKELSPRTRCCRLVFRKVGWLHNGGDTHKHMEEERERERERGETRVPSAPYACLCLTCMAPH